MKKGVRKQESGVRRKPARVGLSGIAFIALALCGSVMLAQSPSAAEYNRRGVEQFKLGHIRESVAAFDRAVAMDPAEAPYNWQRGIALYYAGRYDDGRKQFELHQTVNGNDVENAAWRYLCMARAGSVEAARSDVLPIAQDHR